MKIRKWKDRQGQGKRNIVFFLVSNKIKRIMKKHTWEKHGYYTDKHSTCWNNCSLLDWHCSTYKILNQKREIKQWKQRTKHEELLSLFPFWHNFMNNEITLWTMTISDLKSNDLMLDEYL